jgi:hypothetical protein
MMMTMAEVIKRYLDGHGVDYKLHAANGPTMPKSLTYPNDQYGMIWGNL